MIESFQPKGEDMMLCIELNTDDWPEARYRAYDSAAPERCVDTDHYPTTEAALAELRTRVASCR